MAPKCCHNCWHFWPAGREYGDFAECMICVWFPVKKKTCKKQKPIREENDNGRDAINTKNH